MGYLEIIFIGYVINLMALAFMIVLTLLITLMPLFTRNTLAIMHNMDMAKKGQHLIDDIKLIRKNLPLTQRFTGDDMAIFFPFLYIPFILRIMWYSAKYGFFNGMNMLLEQKRTFLENRYLALNQDDTQD